MSLHSPYGPPGDGSQGGWQQPTAWPAGAVPPYGPPQPRPTNTMAVLALVSAFVVFPLGIVFGAIGLDQIRRRHERGHGLALSGVVIGSVLSAAGLAVLVVVLVAATSPGEVTAGGPPAVPAPVDSPDDIDGLSTFDYAAGQQHVTGSVDYTESPPVGGPHDPYWADCTGTVYTVDIRHENAVHALEHGAVWITYDPDEVDQDGIDALAKLVDGEPGRMLSPYAGLDSAVSVQSWNHQLAVDSADDGRIEQFADLMTFNADVEGHYPEIGASCENPGFRADPATADG